MTTLTSQCYDGTLIVSTIDHNQDGRKSIFIERHTTYPVTTDSKVESIAEIDLPENPESHVERLPFEHREAWRDYNYHERKLI